MTSPGSPLIPNQEKNHPTKNGDEAFVQWCEEITHELKSANTDQNRWPTKHNMHHNDGVPYLLSKRANGIGLATLLDCAIGERWHLVDALMKNGVAIQGFDLTQESVKSLPRVHLRLDHENATSKSAGFLRVLLSQDKGLAEHNLLDMANSAFIKSYQSADRIEPCGKKTEAEISALRVMVELMRRYPFDQFALPFNETFLIFIWDRIFDPENLEKAQEDYQHAQNVLIKTALFSPGSKMLWHEARNTYLHMIETGLFKPHTHQIVPWLHSQLDPKQILTARTDVIWPLKNGFSALCKTVQDYMNLGLQWTDMTEQGEPLLFSYCRSLVQAHDISVEQALQIIPDNIDFNLLPTSIDQTHKRTIFHAIAEQGGNDWMNKRIGAIFQILALRGADLSDYAEDENVVNEEMKAIAMALISQQKETHELREHAASARDKAASFPSHSKPFKKIRRT